MTEPEPAGAALAAETTLSTLSTMKQRRDFLVAGRGRKTVMSGFVLRANRRGAGPGIRVGCVCSKKVGKAVARNRAKRRLKEAARLILPRHGRSGWDYVLIGRREVTAARPFAALLADLRGALARVHS